MNKDQVKGAVKDFGGKIQEEAGKLVGNSEQQAKGLVNQAKGKAQQKVGDLKQAAKKRWLDHLTGLYPLVKLV